MLRSRPPGSILLAIAVLVLLTAWPTQADAQYRRRSRTSVVFIGGFGFPRPVFYDPWYQWGPRRPYGYYPIGRPDFLTSSVRLEVTPRHAEVFVDGYLAGVVDDFDGIFQRLRLAPGAHELAIYLSGYRTIRLSRYFNPGSDQSIRDAMAPLPAGETAEPPPTPPTPKTGTEIERQQRPMEPEPRPSEPPPARFGTLSLRVQPADVEILVDGQPWTAQVGEERMALRLAEGRHRIEIRKDGFATYTEDVLIRRDRSLTLNVSLTRSEVTSYARTPTLNVPA